MKLFRKTEKICQKLDNASLWWTGFLLLAAAFFPYVLLGEGSVFRIHDQLDESLMNYVLPARHLWEASMPVECSPRPFCLYPFTQCCRLFMLFWRNM
mgnify:CR=1 FL=1